jgi:preprotein translocase subunit SecA
LKGRAGRQGDKGRSQFFISLEDDMFVRFAHEEVTKLRKNLHKDSTGLIQSKKIADFVDKVQRICEGSNYGIREYNLKLDNVINEQRSVIYELRNRILTDESILTLLTPMISSTVHYYVEGYCSPEVLPEDWDLNSLTIDLTKVIGESISLDIKGMAEIQDVQEQVEEALQNYLDLIKEVMEEEKPLDGFLRTAVLQIADREWIKHIENMERLKEGIGMRSYSQEDPMRQYQREGLELFSTSYQELEYYMAEALCQATASLRAEK